MLLNDPDPDPATDPESNLDSSNPCSEPLYPLLEMTGVRRQAI
jgi:hypothetical protein